MTESKVVNKWIEETVNKSRLEEARESLIRILRRRFPSVLTEDVLGAINAQPSLDVLHDWFDAALGAFSPEEFLAVLRRRVPGCEEDAMRTITLEEAQSHLGEIIGKLAPGEEVVITRQDRPVARLVGEKRPSRPGPGLGKGMLIIVSDDEEHLKDFAEYMPDEGE